MKVLMISTDRKLFEDNSAVRQRIVEYGSLVDELKIIVFNLSTRESRIMNHESRIFGTNVTLYPTNSRNKLFYIVDAIKIGRRIIVNQKNSFQKPSFTHSLRLGQKQGFKKNFSDWLVTCQDPFETGLVGWVIAKTKRVKLHLQIHTDFLSWGFQRASIFNKSRGQLASFLIMQSDGVRVVSERIKKSIIKWRIAKEEKISVLPIFVDIEKIKNTESKFNLKTRYSQFNFVIFTASRLEKEKNIKMMLKVMKKVVEKYPKTGLVIVGDGSIKQSSQLKAYSLQLQKNVVFESWQKDLVSYYKTADLFLATSSYEGYGMTLLESAVAGCPTLTTDVGLVGDILQKESIEVCSRGSKRCFVNKILNLIENPNRLSEMKIRAQQDVEEKVLKTKEEYLEAYKKDWERCL